MESPFTGAAPANPPKRKQPPLAPTPRDGHLPLSFAQQRLWFLAQLEPGGFAYNAPFFWRMRGPLDATALERSLAEIVRRHESLRTTFAEVDGQPVQRVPTEAAFALAVEHLESTPEPERDAFVRRLAEEEARRPFDLMRGPLFRATLLRLAPDDHALFISVHHIVVDLWSLGVLQRELKALYSALARGEPPPTLPAPPVQYADFVRWQREWMQGEVLESRLAYWRKHLAGAPPLLDLPTDRPRPPRQTFRGALLEVPLSPELASAVRELSRKEGVTVFMTLLAAFQALLSRYTGQPDLVVGSPIAGRTRRELEGLIGFFVNTVALRLDGSGDVTFRELMRRVRDACLGAHAHQDTPFELVVNALQPARDLTRPPLFQVMFDFYMTLPPLDLPGVTARELAFEPGVAKFDLTLVVREAGGGLVCTWEYNTDLFDEATAARLGAHYAELLAGAVARPEQRVSALPLVPEAERRQLLVEWGAPRRDVPLDGCLHACFEEQVARTPDAVAVVHGDASLTFHDLNARANRLAHRLRALGVGPEVRVGLGVEPSLELVVGLLGVLKAGGAYVPLDPTYPRERLAFMLEDSRAEVLLTQPRLRDAFPTRGARILSLEPGGGGFGGEPVSNPTPLATAENLAYLIYTSGSTGRPKGVMIPHGALLNLRRAFHDLAYADLPAPLRVGLNSPISFDASVQQLIQLANGHTLYLIPNEIRADVGALLAFLARQRVDAVEFSPSQLRLAMDAGLATRSEGVPTRVIVGGEATDEALWARLARHPRIVFFNNYGPTECTVDVTCCAIREFPGAPTIGRPLANCAAYVLDPWMRPVPIGVFGELYVGGVQVARGYWARPDLTAERFVPDPFGGVPGARLYRTGDRVRWRADGTLEYQRRLDDQVKVRGFRIELGEVEVALKRCPGVADAAVVVREHGPGDKRLVAYVVGAGVDAAGLKAQLKADLPQHMVPSAFVALERLPLTPNGKLDRKALPEPKGAGREDYVAPRTPMEEVVASVWAPLLGLERVGAHDHFFDAGGHSLLATQAAARLREALQRELPVRALFDAPTVAELAARLEAEAGGGPRTQAPPLAPRARQAAPPLSFAQQRLWFLAQLDPGGFAYNVPFCARLRGRLDVAALERSLAEILRRHEALRTTFAEVEGRPAQRISSEVAWPLEVVEAREEGAAERRAVEEAKRPFDLRAGPLVRARLFRVAPEEHVLALVMHHIVCDGWSVGVLLRELEALYAAFARGGEPALPPLPVQYADYAEWQREWLHGEVREAQLRYWTRQLAEAPASLDLPTDRPRPPVQSTRGALLAAPLPPALSRDVRALGRKEGATLFMMLLAAYQALLSRYTGQADVIVGSPIAGRTRREVEGLVGFFVNTLALRVEVPGSQGFRELLRRVRETCLGAYAHQDMPFEQLVDALRPARDLARPPIFQVAFALQDEPAALALPGLTAEALDLDPGMAKFDLTLFVRDTPGGLVTFWEYNTDLFDRETVARLAAHYGRLLEGAVAAPEEPVAALPLLSEAERRRALVEWNDTRTEYPRTACIHGLFEEQAARAPGAIALDYGGVEWTYGELNRRANQVARHLRRLGVVRGTRVGLCAGRSPEFVVAALGILKAGGAYVPLDPAYPRERLAFMAEDTAVPVVLAQPELAARLPPLDARVVPLDPSWAAFEGERGDDLGEQVPPEALAHVLYTSGSTGRPKGVCIPHQGVVRLVRDTNYLRVTEADRIAHMSNTSFDATTFEVWSALLNGARLVGVPRDVALSPRALAAHVREQRVSVMFVTTALFHQIAAEHPEAFQPLAHVLTGGEAVEARWVRRVLERGAPGRLLIVYGPTECSVLATWYPVEALPEGLAVVPIGKPISNTTAYVLDARMQPVPVEVTGEVYLGGEGVALGYLNRPELTAERFVVDPFSGEPGARLYRTGDLARYLPDGSIEFQGRSDAQVKLRGFRIELGEVEAALAKHPGVNEVVAMVRDDGPAGRWLVAYVVPREGALEPAALRAFLKDRLPEYLTPSAFVCLDALPLTPNGKVDRRALPAPATEAAGEADEAPRTPMEALVESVWAPLLGRPRIGAHESFFELGGHSLLAAQVVSRLREALQSDVPVRLIFEAPILSDFARRLASLPRQEGGPPPSPLVELRGGDGRRPFFCVHPVGGTVVGYLELARLLGPEQPFYGLQSPGLEGAQPPCESIPDMAALYVEAVRTVQPRGPYRLGGWSMGGNVAFEMAQRLRREGESVELLVLIDSFARLTDGEPPPAGEEAARLAGLFYRDLLEAAGQPLPLPDEALAKLEPEAMLRVLEEAGARAASAQGVGPEPLRALRRVFESNLRAAWRYEPQPYAGALVSLEASASPVDHGWAPLALGGVEVQRLEGDHYSILRGPRVEELARRLKALLERGEVAGATRERARHVS